MFENLKLSEFTWPREPVLYLTLLVAVLNVVIQFIAHDITWVQGLETLVILVGGFIARGQVTPMSNLG